MNHRVGTGEALACNIEGGAVIRTSSWFRQAEGDIHRGIEVEELERDQALIVIHGDDPIITSF